MPWEKKLNIERLELSMSEIGKDVFLSALKTLYLDKISPDSTLADINNGIIQKDTNRDPLTKASYNSTILTVNSFDSSATIKNIDYDRLCKLENFMREKKHLAENTIVGNMRNVRTLISEAKKRGLVKEYEDSFRKGMYKIKPMKAREGFLSRDQLEELSNLQLAGNDKHTRDAFLVACYTGLRWSDITTLKTEHLSDGWIKKKIGKTKVWARVPYTMLFENELTDLANKYGSVEKLDLLWRLFTI